MTDLGRQNGVNEFPIRQFDDVGFVCCDEGIDVLQSEMAEAPSVDLFSVTDGNVGVFYKKKMLVSKRKDFTGRIRMGRKRGKVEIKR